MRYKSTLLVLALAICSTGVSAPILAPFSQSYSSGFQVFAKADSAWTPLNFGSALVAWYDASDAATITESAGAVSAWNDKSGSGYHFLQGTAANKPAYSATGLQSNAPGITFDFSNDFLSAASVTIGTNKFSAFILGQFKTGADRNLLGYTANGDAGPYSSNSAIIFETDGAGNALRSKLKSVAKSTVPLAELTSASYYRMGTVYDGANNTTYLDNAYVATPVAATASVNTPGTLLLGARADGTNPWGGAIGEIIILNRDATSDERAKIDTYMLRQWPRVLVTEGDSVVADAVTPQRYVQLFIPNSSPAVYLDDIAVSGTDFWTNAGICLIDRTARTDGHLHADKRGRQYVLYFSFTNNLNGAPYTDPLTPQTTASIAGGYITYATARKAAGWDKVVIATALPRTDAQANDIFRNALNTVLRNPSWAGLVANGGPIDAVCDLAGDAIMGVDASPVVNASYWADSVHPGATGMARLEVIFRATINGL